MMSQKSAHRRHTHGFTLLELLVVMMLLTIVLSVTLPRISDTLVQNPMQKTSRWVINTARALRAAAMETQTMHALVVDLDRNRMWTVHADMDDEDLAAAAEAAFAPAGSVRLVNVIYPQAERIGFGTAEIVFYPAGYTDQSLIHVEYGGSRRFTFQIEPLLPKVRILEEWATY